MEFDRMYQRLRDCPNAMTLVMDKNDGLVLFHVLHDALIDQDLPSFAVVSIENTIKQIGAELDKK